MAPKHFRFFYGIIDQWNELELDYYKGITAIIIKIPLNQP